MMLDQIGNITISDALIITIGGWMITRLEIICREFRKIKKLERQAHPQLFEKIFSE